MSSSPIAVGSAIAGTTAVAQQAVEEGLEGADLQTQLRHAKQRVRELEEQLAQSEQRALDTREENTELVSCIGALEEETVRTSLLAQQRFAMAREEWSRVFEQREDRILALREELADVQTRLERSHAESRQCAEDLQDQLEQKERLVENLNRELGEIRHKRTLTTDASVQAPKRVNTGAALKADRADDLMVIFNELGDRAQGFRVLDHQAPDIADMVGLLERLRSSPSSWLADFQQHAPLDKWYCLNRLARAASGWRQLTNRDVVPDRNQCWESHRPSRQCVMLQVVDRDGRGLRFSRPQ